jgi:platelet-activating factor acetylhydrolase
VKLPRIVSLAVTAATLTFTKLSAYLDAPVAEIRPDQQHTSQASEQDRMKFPVVIFSHGLGGCRTTYSNICGELASHGFVVCAIEHRDGTAAVSSIERGLRTLQYRSPGENEDQYRMRRGQIHYRLGEIHSAWQLLERIHAGDAINNCLESTSS